MITEVFMPKNGMDMHEGKIVRWLKEVGEQVIFDDGIMEIETDKITMEAESPATGTLLAKLYQDGDVVPVLTVIGYIGEKDDVIPEQTAVPKTEQPVASVQEETAVAQAPLASSMPATAPIAGSGVLATPYSKKLAGENNIALSSVVPTGKHGEITGADVKKATMLAQKVADDLGVSIAGISGTGYGGKVTKQDVLSASTNSGNTKAMSGMRKVIATRMLASHLQIPAVTQNMEVEMNALLELRASINADRADKISINDFIIKAVAKAVAQFPAVRSTISGDELTTWENTNIGFAVSVDDGLLVPVIKDANRLSLSEIASTAKELATKARAGGISPDQLSGGTFTISNLGMFGIHSFTPIINQPEAAILGVCAIRDNLALVDGVLITKKMMMISLTFDHRILDGAISAKFQLRIKELLENPIEVLL